MAIGLGSLKKKADKKDKKSSKTNNSNEAAEILKKMDAKAAGGDCPFC